MRMPGQLNDLCNKPDRAKAIKDLSIEMMALDCQPFPIVEVRDFSRLINHLELRCTKPRHSYFSVTPSMTSLHFRVLIGSNIKPKSFL